MRQIRIVGFTCKAKELLSRLQEEWEKAEEKMKDLKKSA